MKRVTIAVTNHPSRLPLPHETSYDAIVRDAEATALLAIYATLGYETATYPGYDLAVRHWPAATVRVTVYAH